MREELIIRKYTRTFGSLVFFQEEFRVKLNESKHFLELFVYVGDSFSLAGEHADI